MSEKKKIAGQYLALIVAIVLLGQFSLPETALRAVRDSAFQNMAAVATGLGAAVQPNEYNSLAQQLEQKKGELTDRERALLAREEAFGKEYADTVAARDRYALYALSGIVLILIFLLLLNFYLDIKRGKSLAARPLAHQGELTTRL